jgi:hypothetical protein
MMKIKHKIAFLCLTTIFVLSLFPVTTLCQTTIGNSSLSVEEGDFFSWKYTYTHPVYLGIAGPGSYHNITVDSIYQGSSSMGGFVEHALIMVVTEGRYWAGLGQHDEWQELPYMVYNKTLDHLYMEDEINFIAPIPLNLTLIADMVGDCTISGNMITEDIGPGEFVECTFNTEGILTRRRYVENHSTTAYILVLEGTGDEAISWGVSFIVPSVGILIVITWRIRKKKNF